jgi:hypothetical protein
LLPLKEIFSLLLLLLFIEKAFAEIDFPPRYISIPLSSSRELAFLLLILLHFNKWICFVLHCVTTHASWQQH